MLSKMVSRLNGWQRLWVVLSIPYMLIVIVLTVANFPHQGAISRERVYDTIRAVGLYNWMYLDVGGIKEQPYTPSEHWVRSEYYAGLSDEEIVKLLHNEMSQKVNFTNIESEYKQKLDALPRRQSMTLGLGFLLLLIPSSAVYSLGLVVAWIINGFRSKKP